MSVADSSMKIRFIISTKAGKAGTRGLEDLILRTFAGFETPDIRLTEYKGHATKLASDWADRWGSRGIVYAGGGDGTLNEVAQALAGRETAMGVIPLGTGNDFARTLYPDRKHLRVEEDIMPLTPKPVLTQIDLLRVNGIYCINAISMGYDTVVLQRAYDLLKRHPRLGASSYGLAVLTTAFAKKKYPFKFTLTNEKGEKVHGESVSSIAFLGNGGFYGSGFNPAPDALLDDGFGNFLIADSLTVGEFLPLISKYKNGTHLGHPKIHTYLFTQIVIESTDGQPFPANYDGVIFSANRIAVEVVPRALNFARLPLEGTNKHFVENL